MQARADDTHGTRLRYSGQARLCYEWSAVRVRALETWGKLEPTTLTRHAGAVAEKLDDEWSCVRAAALRTLRKLEPAMLAPFSAAATRRLDDEYSSVRSEAEKTLRKLHETTANQHPAAIGGIFPLKESDNNLEMDGVVQRPPSEPFYAWTHTDRRRSEAFICSLHRRGRYWSCTRTAGRLAIVIMRAHVPFAYPTREHEKRSCGRRPPRVRGH